METNRYLEKIASKNHQLAKSFITDAALGLPAAIGGAYIGSKIGGKLGAAKGAGIGNFVGSHLAGGAVTLGVMKHLQNKASKGIDNG